MKRNQKIVSKSLPLLLLLCICFSFRTAANIGVGSGAGSLYGDGPVETEYVNEWKVTLYCGKEGATKYSPLSEFERIGKPYIFYQTNAKAKDRGGNTIDTGNVEKIAKEIKEGKKHRVVADGDKLYYIDQYINKGRAINSFFSAHELTENELIPINTSEIPLHLSDGETNDRVKKIEGIFGNDTDDESKKKTFENIVKPILEKEKRIGTMDENDCWVVVFEPIIRAYCRYFYTATEYALAQELVTNMPSDRNKIIFDNNGNYSVNSYLDGKALGTELGYSGQVGIHNVSVALYWKPEERNFFGMEKEENIFYNVRVGKKESPNKYQTLHDEAKTMLEKNIPINSTNSDTWKEYMRHVIKFGGSGFVFSPAFDLPDYTVEVDNIEVEEKWENEEVEISATVRNSNPKKGGRVTVTLEMENPQGDITIDGDKKNPVEKTLNMEDQEKQTVTWEVNVGTYAQDKDNRVRKYKVSVLAKEVEKERETTNNTADGRFTLKRDFAISNVLVNGSEKTVNVHENETVTVTFDVTNNNPFCNYENVPVSVYLYRATGKTHTPLQTTTISLLLKGETKKCTIRVNVGSVIINRDSIFTIVAAVNLDNLDGVATYQNWHESDLSNNLNSKRKGYTSGNILVQRTTKFGLQILAGDYYSDTAASQPSAGRTTGMVTCIIENNSSHHMYPTNDSKDELWVVINYGGKSPILCAPAHGTNTTWFSFTVPKADEIMFRATLHWHYEKEVVDEEGNVKIVGVEKEVSEAEKSAGIRPVTVHKTPDTQLDRDSVNKQLVNTNASNYSKAEQAVLSTQGLPRVAQWDQWQMRGSTFVLHRYALAGKITKAALVPMNRGEDTEYINTKGQIASGSAFSVDFSYEIQTECSVSGDNVKAVSKGATGNSARGDYTPAQNAVALFPEFQYKSDGTNCRTLFFANKSGSSMHFAENENADGNQRVHFTPLNMPDGQYKVPLKAYDLWTPAGMIYVVAAPSLEIHGSIYDYNYMS